jgi:hypothetical protein
VEHGVQEALQEVGRQSLQPGHFSLRRAPRHGPTPVPPAPGTRLLVGIAAARGGHQGTGGLLGENMQGNILQARD